MQTDEISNSKKSEHVKWELWCRLCASNDLRNGNINIFQKVKDKENMTLNEAIHKYFSVNIKPKDRLPKVLCCYCFKLISALIDFNERIFKVQKLFSTFNSNFSQPFRLHLIPEREIHDFWKLKSINTGMKENIGKRKLSVKFKDEITEESKSQVTKNLREKIQNKEGKIKEFNNSFNNIQKFSENDKDASQNRRKKKKTAVKSNEIFLKKNSPNKKSVLIQEFKNKMEMEELIDTIGNVFNEKVGNKDEPRPKQENNKTNRNEIKQFGEKGSNETKESINTVTVNMARDNNNDLLQGKSKTLRKSSTRVQDFELDITCKKCGEQYKSFFPYRQHLRSAHSEAWCGGKWTCPDCDATVLSSAGLARHVLLHNNSHHENIYKSSPSLGDIKMKIPCKKCDIQFKSFFPYRQHLKAAHNLGKIHDEWTCPFCGRIVFYISTFRSHLLTHIPGGANKSHTCSVCTKSFRTKNGLREHILSHTPMEKSHELPCPECDKDFSSRTCLNDHINNAHKIDDQSLHGGSGVPFTTNSFSKNDMFIYDESAPFESGLCKKKLRNAGQHKAHEETGDSQKFTCTLCGLRLSALNLLNRHLAMHNDMKYQCEHCERSFGYISALKVHMLSHAGTNRYSCKFCDRTFPTSLSRHLHGSKMHPKAVINDSDGC
ncbi:uncharacterized protein ACN427_014792 [Glossina fuscipes fuscipes]